MSATADFNRAVNFVLRQEGGRTNDTGGPTLYGVSQRAHPSVDLTSLTIEDAKRIYRRDYWDALDLGELPHPVALAMLEASVNLGCKAAVRRLQIAVNQLSGRKCLKVDGWLGPLTRSAVLEHPGTILAMLVAISRLEIHCRLAAKPDYAGYLRGWGLRCVRLCEHLARDWAKANKE